MGEKLRAFFEKVASGDQVKVHLPYGGFVVGPGVDPTRPRGYRVTYFWSCRCCGRIFPNVELADDLCPDCRRDGAQ